MAEGFEPTEPPMNLPQSKLGSCFPTMCLAALHGQATNSVLNGNIAPERTLQLEACVGLYGLFNAHLIPVALFHSCHIELDNLYSLPPR
jgi:hypothetical protein